MSEFDPLHCRPQERLRRSPLIIFVLDSDKNKRELLRALTEEEGYLTFGGSSGNSSLEVLKGLKDVGLKVNVVLSEEFLEGEINGLELARIAHKENLCDSTVLITIEPHLAEEESYSEIDTSTVTFDLDKIAQAIEKALSRKQPDNNPPVAKNKPS